MADRQDSKLEMLRPTMSLYANYFEVGHTPFEFVLDFGQSYANGETSYHTRIVTSPTYARALLDTLAQAFEDYRQDLAREAPKEEGT
jgi:hypothetical protein